MTLKAPFPYFGGKSKVASDVWERFGDVQNYVEPFCGSAAVLLARPSAPRIETVNDANCVAPDTRILRADLTWAKASEIRVGDKLIAFDEFNGKARLGLRAPERYRHWKITTVTATKNLERPRYRLGFDDGTVVVASGDHMWLGGSHRTGGRGWRWLRTDTMVCNRKEQRSWVLKLVPVVDREQSWEAGWLGGLFDGEGHLTRSAGWRMVLSQNSGMTLDRVRKLLSERGFKTSDSGKRRCTNLLLQGGMREASRLLMMVRPERLIAKFQEKLSSASLYGREHQAVGVVSKESLGVGEVVAIETEAHTFIAEGLASHNCFIANFWRAVANDPKQVANFADWPVNEADLHARHRWLMLSESSAEWRERMKTDPDFFDPKVAGWWVWGASCWIGAGWCDGGRLFARDGGPSNKEPETRVCRGDTAALDQKRPAIANSGRGVATATPLMEWFETLHARLRRVRVVCGDWSRVLTPAVTHGIGTTAVFLDPPYSREAGRTAGIYSEDDLDVAHLVRKWAIENGGNQLLRIALCGYEGEHELPTGWTVHEWHAQGGYANQRKSGAGYENRKRERVWFSPHCLGGQQGRLVA